MRMRAAGGPLALRGALLGALLLALLGILWALPAWAEFRAYELEVTDILECRLKKREQCKSLRVLTSMAPDLYTRTHGGPGRIGAVMMATWVCWGDTSNFRAVCPRPPPRKPRFAVGDEVSVRLRQHITEGWRGKVEIAYFQRSVSSNVYGVRFADRQGVYARYFEKDLTKPGAPAAAPAQQAAQ